MGGSHLITLPPTRLLVLSTFVQNLSSAFMQSVNLPLDSIYIYIYTYLKMTCLPLFEGIQKCKGLCWQGHAELMKDDPGCPVWVIDPSVWRLIRRHNTGCQFITLWDRIFFFPFVTVEIRRSLHKIIYQEFTVVAKVEPDFFFLAAQCCCFSEHGLGIKWG